MARRKATRPTNYTSSRQLGSALADFENRSALINRYSGGEDVGWGDVLKYSGQRARTLGGKAISVPLFVLDKIGDTGLTTLNTGLKGANWIDDNLLGGLGEKVLEVTLPAHPLVYSTRFLDLLRDLVPGGSAPNFNLIRPTKLEFQPNDIGFIEGLTKGIEPGNVLGQFEHFRNVRQRGTTLDKLVATGHELALSIAADPSTYVGGAIVKGASGAATLTKSSNKMAAAKAALVDDLTAAALDPQYADSLLSTFRLKPTPADLSRKKLSTLGIVKNVPKSGPDNIAGIGKVDDITDIGKVDDSNNLINSLIEDMGIAKTDDIVPIPIEEGKLPKSGSLKPSRSSKRTKASKQAAGKADDSNNLVNSLIEDMGTTDINDMVPIPIEPGELTASGLLKPARSSKRTKASKQAIEKAAQQVDEVQDLATEASPISKIIGQSQQIKKSNLTAEPASPLNVFLNKSGLFGKMIDQAADNIIDMQLEDIVDQAVRDSRGFIEFKFKPTGSSFKSYKLYDTIERAWGPFKATTLNRGFSKAFNPTMQFTDDLVDSKLSGGRTVLTPTGRKQYLDAGRFSEEIYRLKRRNEAYNLGNMIDELKKVSTILGKSSPEMREAATIAISRAGAIGNPELAALVQNITEFRASLHARGRMLGLWNSKFNPRELFVLEDNGIISTVKPLAGAYKGTPSKLGDVVDALNSGRKVERDISQILTSEIKDFYSRLTRQSFITDFIDEFGVAPKNAREVARLQKLGFAQITKELVDVGDKVIMAPRPAMKALSLVEKIMYNPESGNSLMVYVDKVMNAWRFSATATNPAHHANNALGDALANFFDDVKISSYSTYRRLLKDPDTAKIAVGDTKLSLNELKALYNAAGGRTNHIMSEFSEYAGLGGALSRVTSKIRDFSDYNETFFRHVHFLDALQSEAKTGIPLFKAAQKAVDRVNMFHFDYRALTNFEKNVRRFPIPFYTWMRKNLPMQFANLFLRPGKVAQMRHFQTSIMDALGIQQDEYDQTIGWTPWYVKATLSPIVLKGGNGFTSFPIIANPAIPFSDFTRTASNPMNTLQNSLNPFIKMLTAEETQGGGGFMDAVNNINWMPRLISTLLRDDRTSTEKKLRIINQLTGAGLIEINPRIAAQERRGL